MTRLRNTTPVIIVLLLVVNLLAVSSLAYGENDTSWDDYVVVGDAFRIEFFLDRVPGLVEDYGLEALHNSVGAWIDYREWMRYPAEWDVNIARLIRGAHSFGVPIGVTFGYHVGDSVTASYNDNVGFLHYYRAVLPMDSKWRYPNGTIAKDPYSVGSSRSFSGYYVIRVLGDPMDIERLQRLDFYSTMHPQNPYWKDFFIEWGKKAIDKGSDTFFIDNPDGIFTLLWGGGWGCTDTWEGQGLISYLKDRFSEQELRSLGVSDVDSFCLRDYLVKKYGEPAIFASPYRFRERFMTSWPIEIAQFRDVSKVMQDPIMKEALLYWYSSAISFVKEAAYEFKRYAAEKGRDILLTSNNYFAWIPHITIAPYMDALYVETNQNRPPPSHTRPLVCKLGISSVNGSKPVWIGEWILNFANPYEPDKPPRDISNLVKLRVAEAYASGCIMLAPLGTGHPSEGWPPKRLIAGSERAEVSKYYRFIKQNKILFKDVTSLADVAILASLPSAVWKYLPALGLFEGDILRYQYELFGWARVFESLGIPYDVLLLGMDGLLKTDSHNRLGNYRLIVATQTSHISDDHLVKLLEYLETGGLLIATRDLGRYDDKNNIRWDLSIVNKILQHPNTIVVDDHLGMDYMKSLDELRPNEFLFKKMSDAVKQQLGRARTIVRVSSPNNIYVSVLGQKTSNRIIIHLVNYNYRFDSERDYVDVRGPVNITLRLPRHFQLERLSLLTPDLNATAQPTYEISPSGELNINLPQTHLWTIIVIEPKREKITETTTETTTAVRTQQTTETRISTKTQLIETTLEKTYTTTTTQTIHSTETSTTYIPTETPTQPYIPLIIGIAIGAITTTTILKTRTKKQNQK